MRHLAPQFRLAFVGLSLAALTTVSPAHAQEAQEAQEAPAGWKIHKAMLAAPPSVSEDATIYERSGENGSVWTVLRYGTNGWGCFPGPDDAMTPACWNAAAIEQMKAETATGTEDGRAGGFEGVAISYMLAGNNPHLMIFVDGVALADLPVDGESGGPWLMGEGEGVHLMIPIRQDG